MQLHNLKRKTKNKKSVQVGRGGKRGKTSGRGTKGQKARAGRKMRPEMRDIIKKLPKLRGYDFQSRHEKPVVVTLAALQKNTSSGDTVTREFLAEKKLVSIYKGKMPAVKIVGDKKESAFSNKITLVGIKATASVKAAIEKAGGEVK
ncbi:MAG TPA: uL15 family ribosomal protein [Candidatus Paceibacterota bacterium]|nr:uL15 family ribosomal protein [Candidatus Paceibacterota bacterium]